MAVQRTQDVTHLLQAWRQGESAAFERLIHVVYSELHRLAHLQMRRERRGHPLQTTALINETYLRLVDANQIEWRDRTHFFSVAARVMRRILVEIARSRRSARRGGNVMPVQPDENLLDPARQDSDLLALDEALDALAKLDSRQAKVVELRFFGGLSVEETAEALNVSCRTVIREWVHAKLWLLEEMQRCR